MQTRNVLQTPHTMQAPTRVRCACRRCGSHVLAVVYKQTLSGVCGNCKSPDIAPLASPRVLA